MGFGELQGYRDNKGFGSSVIMLTADDPKLYGQTVTLMRGNTILKQSIFNLSGKCEIVTRDSGELIILTETTDNEVIKDTIEIGVYGTYNKTISTVKVYSFRIAKNVSDPKSRVEYFGDTAALTPAKMNYTTGAFEYGSWENAFFMPKPCMLKYDGTVDYYLDPNDYTKKADGTDSDVANSSYGGNAMMEFPTVWLYCYEDASYEYYNVANKKVNDSYEAYAHHSWDGNIVPYVYMPIYNGAAISSKLRSLSGQSIMNNQNATTEVNYAKANGSGWWTEVFADRMLVNTLLMLISKSTDGQTAFGNGHNSGGSSAASLLTTGSMNKRGLFWGTNGNGNGVKVFGMENWWGNQWRRIAGWINANGTQKVKWTYGKEDGSSVNGYNTDGSGYLTIANATPGGTSGGYINKTIATAGGKVPTTASGSATTYECDGMWYNNSQNDYAVVGGSCDAGSFCGPFAVALDRAASSAGWAFGASVSYKPSVTTA